MLYAYDGSLGFVYEKTERLKAQASKATRQIQAFQWHKYMYIHLIFSEESKSRFILLILFSRLRRSAFSVIPDTHIIPIPSTTVTW